MTWSVDTDLPKAIRFIMQLGAEHSGLDVAFIATDWQGALDPTPVLQKVVAALLDYKALRDHHATQVKIADILPDVVSLAKDWLSKTSARGRRQLVDQIILLLTGKERLVTLPVTRRHVDEFLANLERDATSPGKRDEYAKRSTATFLARLCRVEATTLQGLERALYTGKLAKGAVKTQAQAKMLIDELPFDRPLNFEPLNRFWLRCWALGPGALWDRGTAEAHHDAVMAVIQRNRGKPGQGR